MLLKLLMSFHCFPTDTYVHKGNNVSKEFLFCTPIGGAIIRHKKRLSSCYELGTTVFMVLSKNSFDFNLKLMTLQSKNEPLNTNKV